MSAKIYEPCPHPCSDGRIRGVNQFGIWASVECPCRGTKFIEIGLTVNQLERLTMKADGLDRVERLVKPLDIVELGIAAERLSFHGAKSNAGLVEEVQEALAGVNLVLTDVKRRLSRTPDATKEGEQSR